MSRHTLLHNTLTTIFWLTAAALLSFVFFLFTKNTTNVTIIYMLAILLVARQTVGYIPGIVASFIGVISINYLFTYPYMELNFSMDGYPLTYLGMTIISSITSTLTTHLKEQTRLSNEREHMLMEAEKEKMRANLLRAISHDLRTPLTGIIGTADSYLKHGKMMTESEKEALVRTISEDSNWLLQMVENLLSVTRIQGEGASVIKTLEPLEEVVSDAVSRFQKRFPGTPVQVQVPLKFIMIPMDAILIEQVLINLMENAAYHSNSTQPIEINVTVDDRYAVFSVRDHGNGIPKDQLDTLFDGYSSGQNRGSDSHKGIGIGLSICKTIIKAHEGRIFAKNREDGAELIFTLPKGDEHFES